MRDVDRLVAVGVSAASALTSQETWIHRRVESITFPFPTRPVYRRHVSVDFTIPADLKPVAEEGDDDGAFSLNRFYVPVSLVRRWPPLPRLDLRDGQGDPIPFLTGRQNTVLDSVALRAIALDITKGEVSNDLLSRIGEIVSLASPADRTEAFRNVSKPPDESAQTNAAKAHRALCDDPVFRALSQALIKHTLLWLRVEGKPEDREIVKFSYDVPLSPNGFDDRRPSFGLGPFVFEFEVPHLGTTSSYHCNVVAPPPLEVVRAELALYEPSPEDDKPGQFANQVRHDVDSVRPRPPDGKLALFAGIAESQAKFYASGDRTGLGGKLWVAVLIQSQGLLGGALAASVTSLAILISFTALLPDTVAMPEAAVAVLLVSPAVLGYLLVKPSESALVGGFLIALRRVIILSGALPVLGAAVLALSSGQATFVEYLLLSAISAMQAVTVVLIAAAFRAGRQYRKDYRAHEDARLVD